MKTKLETKCFIIPDPLSEKPNQCPHDAVWRIHGPGPDDYTQSCQDHLKQLKSMRPLNDPVAIEPEPEPQHPITTSADGKALMYRGRRYRLFLGASLIEESGYRQCNLDEPVLMPAHVIFPGHGPFSPQIRIDLADVTDLSVIIPNIERCFDAVHEASPVRTDAVTAAQSFLFPKFPCIV